MHTLSTFNFEHVDTEYVEVRSPHVVHVSWSLLKLCGFLQAALGYLDHPNDAVRKQVQCAGMSGRTDVGCGSHVLSGQAAETSATLVLRDDQHSVQGTARKQQRYNAAVRQQYVRVVVQQLLERLLTMGNLLDHPRMVSTCGVSFIGCLPKCPTALTDPLPAIRLSVLKALDSRFDTSLAQVRTRLHC